MRSTTVELSSGKNVKVYADDLKKITKKYEEQKEVRRKKTRQINNK